MGDASGEPRRLVVATERVQSPRAHGQGSRQGVGTRRLRFEETSRFLRVAFTQREHRQIVDEVARTFGAARARERRRPGDLRALELAGCKARGAEIFERRELVEVSKVAGRGVERAL